MLVLVDVLGWLGGVMIAGGYLLVSVRRISAESRLFQALNAVGAAFLGASCVATGSLPSAVLNGVWLTIGVRALVSAQLQERRAPGAGAQRADFAGAT